MRYIDEMPTTDILNNRINLYVNILSLYFTENVSELKVDGYKGKPRIDGQLV